MRRAQATYHTLQHPAGPTARAAVAGCAPAHMCRGPGGPEARSSARPRLLARIWRT